MHKELEKENEYQVGILSYNINTAVGNYGAALHSWALQKYLDKIGVSNVIIDYKTSKHIKFLLPMPQKKNFAYRITMLFSKYKRHIIRKFFQKNCIITKNTYFKDKIENINTVQQFCINTDITWVATKNGYNKAFMCDYENMKKLPNIAYSVDTDSKDIPKEYQASLKKYSNNFKHISLRNIYRINHVKDVINRADAVITIDPTLLLDETDYLSITKNIRLKNYVLVYNCQENRPEMVAQAIEFAKLHKLKVKVINCYRKNCTNQISDIPTPVSVEAFLGLIKNCNYFFTNSYHGICFATIFKKNFFAFAREGNNEKILTILEIIGLKDRLIQSISEASTEDIDYEQVYSKIEPLKQFSQNWLKDCVTLPKK